MSGFIPLNDESKKLLVKLINRQNGLDLPDSFLDYGLPRTLTPPEKAEYQRNTEVVLTARPGATHERTQKIYYDRLDIGKVFDRFVKVPVLQPFANSVDVLEQINSLYGLHLVSDEIVAIQAVDHSVRLTIRDSYLWLPGSFIEIGVRVDEAVLVEIEDFNNRIWQFTNFEFADIIRLPVGN